MKGVFGSSHGPDDDVSQIRDVVLLPGEQITHVFSADQGLTRELPVAGQVLITTDRRILAFCRSDGQNETYVVPVADLKGVAVKSATRRWGSLGQGLMLGVGALLVYIIGAYWLTGRFDGPKIPVINMDVVALLVLIGALVGVYFIGRHYFGKGDGSISFQGSNWAFVFPYKGQRAGQEIYQVVNTVFAAHASRDGRSFLWED